MPCLGFEGSWSGFGTRYYFRHNVVSFFSLRVGMGLALGQTVLHKFEEASEDQKDWEFGSGTAMGPHREAVWC